MKRRIIMKAIQLIKENNRLNTAECQTPSAVENPDGGWLKKEGAPDFNNPLLNF